MIQPPIAPPRRGIAHAAAPGRHGKALIAVVTIVDEEFDAAKAMGGFAELAGETAYLSRRPITAGQVDVLLAKASDRGNPPCQTLVRDLVEDYRPEFIVLSGIAGGMDGRDGVALGDVVVADLVENYEMQKLVDGKIRYRKIASDHPSLFLRDRIARRVQQRGRWHESIAAERPSAGTPKIVVGNLIAGDKVLGDGRNPYQKEILEAYDRAVAVDMESSGMARGVFEARVNRHYNLHYLVVRGISDLVGATDNNEVRKKWRDYAAASAAAFALAVADELVAMCEA